MAWQVGIDIGGSFTDIVAANPSDGVLRTAKVRTLAGEPVASVDAALDAVGLGWDDVDDLMHGTTLATNAIVEDKLAPVALLATEGFGDVLAIGRQNRRDLYRLDVPPKLAPLVPDERRLEVRERIDATGAVVTPLTEAAIEGAVRAVAALGVEAVAVALLNAYANPAHEEALGERLAGVVPYVTLSHRVNPEAREYERTSAAVLNAALMPATAGYLDRLQNRANGATRLHLFHSAGGMASPEAVRERPLTLALSGPAAGVAAAGRVAGELGLEMVISFDMGGTTTDVCLVVDGAARISAERLLGGRPIRQPMVAVESIGAGGGSIAMAQANTIRVGPQSAGADPGPACYGLGGERPTVSDANLVLGYLSHERLLGGTVRLDRGLAERAVASLAEGFAMSVDDAALGIHRIANANMARALRRVTVERGVDARDCALLAFGGAGPMHAVALAREFGIGRIVVPHSSSVFSALGCLTAELSYARQRTVHMASDAWDAERFAALRSDTLERLTTPLLAAGHGEDELRVAEIAAIRYAGQSYAVEVPYAAPADPARLDADFKALHRALYGFATDEPWEVESLRLTVSAPPAYAPECAAAAGGRPGEAAGEAAPRTTAPCRFEGHGALETPRFDRGALGVGQRIAGPAVIEDEWSTIVLNPGAEAWADGSGHLHIDPGEPA